jgi:amino acid adenylation domain-containing protein
MEPGRTLISGFLRSVKRHPSRPALEVDGETLSYTELYGRAGAIAAELGEPPLTALLAARSASAYAAVLGALVAGHGYVPLNPRFPARRNAAMLERSGARTLVVDAEGLALADELLPVLEQPPRVVNADAIDSGSDWEPAPAPSDAVAYLLFTSGSTGVPKGVAVSHANVVPFLDAVVERYEIGEEDRCSQTFDLTFDLSVFDMFVAWERGACLCVPSARELMAPGGFVRRAELTVWFSVPSTAAFMNRLRQLQPGAFPTLRWSLFCGEPLPAELASAFGAAAPASVVENLYGPTEATIACTAYRWDPERSPDECVRGIVPIGAAFGTTRTLVVGDDLRELSPGGQGELLLAGPQVTSGYWNDPERTAEAFVTLPGRPDVHYRTGDRVRSGAPLVYLGRADSQIKVLGHRVELGEIEAALREVARVDEAVALGWPPTDSGAGGIVAFIPDPGADPEALRLELASRLPEYMVPRRFELRRELPLNPNGKLDRRALRESLG